MEVTSYSENEENKTELDESLEGKDKLINEKISKLLVIRHSERIDEIDRNIWENEVKNNINNDKRNLYSRRNDPRLTENGRQMAKEVALSIKQEISLLDEDIRNNIRYIYCSKLFRAIQTAEQIALVLNLPIVLSSNFAKTAQAVEDTLYESNMEKFEFLTIEELNYMCPDVEFIDGDIINENVAPNLPIDLNNRNWKYGIEYLISQYQYNILVCHRETIRNLIGSHLKLPYCCYADFNFLSKLSFSAEDYISCTTRKFVSVKDRNGNILELNRLVK